MADEALERVSGRFAPGVSGNPKGRPPKSGVRADEYSNPFTGHGTTRDRRGLTRYRGEWVSDEEALDLWESEFLAARIIEALPEEAFRRGWNLKLEDKETAEEVCALAEDLGVEEALVEAAEKERALGGAAIFPVIDGAQGDLARPLDWGSISSVTALHVLEPRELTPIAFHESLSERQFRRPSMYMFTPLTSGYGAAVGTQAIHASRLIVFPGLQVSAQRRGARLGWGVSVLARPKRVLADFGLAWGSAATLLHEHGVGVLAMDGYDQLMGTAEGEAIVERRLAGMLMGKSTLRALVVDSKDKYERLASSLSGLAEVLNEFKVLMSAASDGMPVSVLMGQSQSGLRTGDDDTRTWYANVEKRRAKRYRPRHEQVLRFLFRAADGPTGGNEPEVWSVEYPPLWAPSEKEVAEIRKLDMDRAKLAIEAGVASADDVAESFYGGDTYSGDIRIDWERRKAQQNAEEEAAAELEGEDMEAMGYEEELSDEELEELELEDLEEDEEDLEDVDEEEDAEADEDEDRLDGDEWREDKAGGKRAAAGGARGKGYNPNRSRDGKFAAGVKKADKAKTARPKFDATPFKKRIADAKRDEAAARKVAIGLRPEITAARKASKDKKVTERQRFNATQKLQTLEAARQTARESAAAAKERRQEANTDLYVARREYARQRKEEIAKRKEDRAAAKAQRDKTREEKRKTKEPPAAPPAEQPRLIHADARAALDAARRGDFNTAMTSVDRVLELRGYSKGDPPNRRVDVSDDGLVMTDVHGRNVTALAFRENDTGRIQLSTATAEGIQRFAAVTKGTEVDDAISAATRKYHAASSTGNQRQSELAYRELSELHRARADDAEAIRTQVHEQVHGFGPTRGNAYQGAGAAIEEVATEVASRVIARDVFRVPDVPHTGLPNADSYGDEVRAATRAIHEVTGRDMNSSYRVLERVAERYKRRNDRFDTSAEVRDAFAADMATESGSKDVRSFALALSRNLAGVLRGT